MGSSGFFFPAETQPQAGTIMAWPTEASILGEAYEYAGANVSETRAEVAAIARAIAKHQMLHLFVKDPKAGDDYKLDLETAQAMLGNVHNVTIHVTPNVHSLWARDTGPISIRSLHGAVTNTWFEGDDAGVGFQAKCASSTTVGMLLNYNQWGRKNSPNSDMYLAATISAALNRSSVLAPFIAEGGGIEVDGEGTLLATESSIINPNRNPGIDKATMERYFAEVFGIEKTIWIPGRRGGDITDDHIDAIARFAKPGVVLVSKPFVTEGSEGGELDNYNAIRNAFENETDARGRKVKIIDVPESDPAKVLGKDYHPDDGPTVSYVNYLVTNEAVIVASFGDEEADARAAKIIGEQYPGRVVEQVYLHQLAIQGGGIHCATQQILA